MDSKKYAQNIVREPSWKVVTAKSERMICDYGIDI
jgi:hypothetical protein